MIFIKQLLHFDIVRHGISKPYFTLTTRILEDVLQLYLGLTRIKHKHPISALTPSIQKYEVPRNEIALNIISHKCIFQWEDNNKLFLWHEDNESCDPCDDKWPQQAKNTKFSTILNALEFPLYFTVLNNIRRR